MIKLHQMMARLLMLSTLAVQAQTREITGKVTDPSGPPIPSADIRIKGTRTETSADYGRLFQVKCSRRQISSISGNPGDPVNIVLRGIHAIRNGNRTPDHGRRPGHVDRINLTANQRDCYQSKFLKVRIRSALVYQ